MLTAYSRVSVVTADRVVDLALPSALPIADVLPQILRYAAPTADGPVAWTLARVGGPPLALGNTLSEAGVLDGDVLELRPQTESLTPARVEDVRDAVEDNVDAAGGLWTTRTTGSFVVLAGAGLLLLTALVAYAARWAGLPGELGRLDSTGSAAVAVVALVAAVAWTARFGRDLDGQVAAGVAMVWAALLGLAIGRAADLDGAVTALLAAVLVAVAAGASRALAPSATGHAAFAVVLLALAVAYGAAHAAGVHTAAFADVAAVLAVLLVGVVPRLSLSVGGLASADYRVRHVGQLDLETLRARYRTSNAVVVGALAGLSLAAAGLAAYLDLTGEPWDRTVAVVVCLALLLRSRLFSRTQHMVAPRGAAVVVLALVAVREALRTPALLPWLVAIGSALLLGAIGLASSTMSDISRARVKRLLNVAEFVAVVVMVVVALGALGVFAQFGGLFT